jgi:hypothetical protein
VTIDAMEQFDQPALDDLAARVSDSSLVAMKTAFPPHENEGERYGYGLEIHDDGFGHAWDMLGYVSYMRADAAAGLGALAIATGRRPPDPEPELSQPLVDDGTCPEQWTPFLGRFRSHNPWLPTFLIAAREQRLVMGIDWLDGSERLSLVPVETASFRVGERDWSPERVRFDTETDGLAQRAVYSGTPYYRAVSWP